MLRGCSRTQALPQNNRYMKIDNLKQHRSVRNFKADDISDEILADILECAVRASNTGNMQIYSIIVTKQQFLREQLCEKGHFNQKMVKGAPVHLTFCADLNRFNKWCLLRNAKPGYDNFLTFFTASVDAIIAAQNACIAAEMHGLGICYLGTVNYMVSNIADILKLPEGVVPVASVVMGYPAEIPELTHRLPLEAVVHYETYNDYSDDSIDALYAERESLEETRNLIAENETENLAQIFTDKRYTKANNIAFSKSLLSFIEKQGFMNHE